MNCGFLHEEIRNHGKSFNKSLIKNQRKFPSDYECVVGLLASSWIEGAGALGDIPVAEFAMASIAQLAASSSTARGYSAIRPGTPYRHGGRCRWATVTVTWRPVIHSTCFRRKLFLESPSLLHSVESESLLHLPSRRRCNRHVPAMRAWRLYE